MAKIRDLKDLKKVSSTTHDSNIVWSDDGGDLRKNKDNSKLNQDVNEKDLVLELRRLTSGKGRTVIEIKGLPQNRSWCKGMAKTLKKKMGVGGAYKSDFIEVHSPDFDRVVSILDEMQIKWKKTGG